MREAVMIQSTGERDTKHMFAGKRGNEYWIIIETGNGK